MKNSFSFKDILGTTPKMLCKCIANYQIHNTKTIFNESVSQ